MKVYLSLGLTALLVVGHFFSAAQPYALVKDLRNEWKIYDGGQYTLYHGEKKANTIYFLVEATAFPGMFLHMNSPAEYTLFVNGQLAIKTTQPRNLSLDSLSERFGAPILQMAVHQSEIHEGGLVTTVVSRGENSVFGEMLSPHYSAFRDFAIVGIMVLIIMFIIITQLNPKLASDYFSITKIFSMREGDDGQSRSRITSSINILFYAYSSLMLGYFLMIIYHFLPHEYPTALYFQSVTFWEAMYEWLELSLLVLLLFFVKIVMVFGLSYVFGMKEIGGVHFFNWVRLLVGVFGVLTVVLFVYFISHGYKLGFYNFLLGTVAWVFAGWMILIILKLRHRLEHSMFHLFSYICATELLPFLITIKVLYY
ncbi:MAG: DUF4271 domain-containing protein [Chryseolinea sp.]